MIVAHIEYQKIDTFGNYAVLKSLDYNVTDLINFTHITSADNYYLVWKKAQWVYQHPEDIDREKLEITDLIINDKKGKPKMFYKYIITFKKG